MRTECNPTRMRFARLKGRDVVADFEGGRMTSDAGALLLGATDRTVALRIVWCTMWRRWWASVSSAWRATTGSRPA